MEIYKVTLSCIRPFSVYNFNKTISLEKHYRRKWMMIGRDFLLVGYLMRNIKSCASTNELGDHWAIQSLLPDYKKKWARYYYSGIF